jgi:hypothetical protein
MFGLEVTVKCFAQLKQRVTIHLLSISGQDKFIPDLCRDNKLFVGHGWVGQYCKNKQPVVLYSMPQNQDIYSIIVSNLQIRIRDPVPY